MSISQFKTYLQTYVRNWCEANGQSIDNGKSRGLAFENFVFETLVSRFELDGASIEENVFRSDERGFDIILPPSGNSDFFIVCQCEMGGAIIARHLHDRIFERFEQGQEAEGSGLGLAIVKEICLLHGGEASYSELGGWACFTLTLPQSGTRE